MDQPGLNNELKSGRALPVMEEFYTIQGEGFNTGLAAYFLRIGGCDVGCRWCDVKESWNAQSFPPVSTDAVIQRIIQCPAGAAVITGGEPMLYNLDYLCSELRKAGVKTFLETSGSQELSGSWDWICLSPKKESPPVGQAYLQANELKVIIEDTIDFTWAEEQAARVSTGCYLFLQPEWSQYSRIIGKITDYILGHPKWRISLQSHKYMHIP